MYLELHKLKKSVGKIGKFAMKRVSMTRGTHNGAILDHDGNLRQRD